MDRATASASTATHPSAKALVEVREPPSSDEHGSVPPGHPRGARDSSSMESTMEMLCAPARAATPDSSSPWASHRLPPRSWYSLSAWTRSSASPPSAWWSDPRAHAEAAAVNSVETPSVQFFTLLAHTSTQSIRRSGWRVSVNVKGEKAGCLRSICRSKSGRSTTIFRDEL